MGSSNTTRLNHQEGWQYVMDNMKDSMTAAAYSTLLADAEWMGENEYGGLFTIKLRTERSVLIVEDRHADRITNMFRFATGNSDATFKFVARGRSINRPSETKGVEKTYQQQPPPPPNQPPPLRQNSMRPGDAMIRLHQDDPQKRGFVSLPHYTMRFWRPFLGGINFDLWQILRSYGYHAGYSGAWPTISLLSEILAIGTRHTILGRGEAGSVEKGSYRKAQIGIVETLGKHNLLSCTTKGDGRQRVYFFTVVDTAPVLTPIQASTLPDSVQREHTLFLKRTQGFNHDLWLKVEKSTLLDPLCRGHNNAVSALMSWT